MDNEHCGGECDGNPEPPDFLKRLLGIKPKEREQICFLDADDIKGWNDLKVESKRIAKEREILSNKAKIFWANLELKYGVSGREGLDIDETTTALTADKEK